MTAEPKARYDVRADVLYLFCEEGEIARKVPTEKVIASLHAKQAGVL
jgi:uncharacterized protein YuzE